MQKTSTVVPAYGRDYKSRAAALADWEAGKDFLIPGGSYVNKEDADSAGLSIRIRYQRMTRVVEVPR